LMRFEIGGQMAFVKILVALPFPARGIGRNLVIYTPPFLRGG
jgi:hypothetical protein